MLDTNHGRLVVNQEVFLWITKRLLRFTVLDTNHGRLVVNQEVSFSFFSFLEGALEGGVGGDRDQPAARSTIVQAAWINLKWFPRR